MSNFSDGTIFSLAKHRVVSSDGNGRIYTANGDGTDRVLFPWYGWDPSYCWGGHAIIFISYDRQRVWVADLAGLNYYDLGIASYYLARPQLSWNNSLYLVSAFNYANNTWDVYACGGGGYNLTRILRGAISPGCINSFGTVCYAGGWTPDASYRVFGTNTTDGPGMGPNGERFWQVFYEPLSSDYPHCGFPAIGPPSAPTKLCFVIGNFAGLDLKIPQTYKLSDIMVSENTGAGAIKVTGSPTAPGHQVFNPSFWHDATGVIYDFVTPTGSGAWAVGIPAWGGSGGGGVWAWPNDAILESNGCNRVSPILQTTAPPGGGG